MTVQELINFLSTIKDRNVEVIVNLDDSDPEGWAAIDTVSQIVSSDGSTEVRIDPVQ